MVLIIKLAVLGSTKGSTLQYIIDAIEQEELDASIEVVISNKENPYILERARKYGIEAIYLQQLGKTRKEFDIEVMKILERKGIELVLLIGYMRYLSTEFVEKWRYKIMNVHPSLLPKFAGGMDLNVHKAVIDAGEKESGMTIHFVDEGPDTGPIILQKSCTIEPDDTPETLKQKIQLLEGEGFIEAIKFFQDGKIKVEKNKVIINE